MSEESIYKFEISGGNFYDGLRHTVFRSQCTLTNVRLMMQDFKGGTRQILLRDIVSVVPETRMLYPKGVRVNIAGPTVLDISCKSKDEVMHLAGMINEAISSQFS